jgi:hypothetical protein
MGTLFPSQTVSVSSSGFTSVKYDDGSAFTDDTIEAQSSGGTAYTVLNGVAATPQYFYVGSVEKLSKIFFDIATAGAGVTLAAEYYNGTTWTALSIAGNDGTSNLTQDGTITFIPPIDWEKNQVDSVYVYWVRLKSTTDITTPPTAYLTVPNDVHRLGIYAQPWDSSPALLVDRYGNTGVNTASPGEKLDVNGNINVASGYGYRVNGTQVVGARQSAVTTSAINASQVTVTGTDQDSVARTQINNLQQDVTNLKTALDSLITKLSSASGHGLLQ